MYLYHGTDSISAKDICSITGIDVKKGSDKADFGPGFYTTDSFEKATRWAYRKTKFAAYGAKPAVVTIVFDYDAANNYIQHFSDDLRWGRFIVNNRNGSPYIEKVGAQEHNLDSRYDITCGRIADFEIINIAEELNKTGQLLLSIEKILNPSYPLQYVFHSVKSLSFIKKVSYRIV